MIKSRGKLEKRCEVLEKNFKSFVKIPTNQITSDCHPNAIRITWMYFSPEFFLDLKLEEINTLSPFLL
jgi:hypothetical protein